MSARIAGAVGFLACILLANYVTTEYGMVPVGFGYVATAGTYFAGLTFVLRDAVQDAAGRWVTIALIAVGAGLSYLVADPFIATASGVAFLAAELADLAIYTPLRKRGYVRAAVASNIVGAVVDTFLFLWIAGFPIAGAWQGQMIGKVAVTAAVVTLVVSICTGCRARAAQAALNRTEDLAQRLTANGPKSPLLTQPLAAKLIREAIEGK